MTHRPLLSLYSFLKLLIPQKINVDQVSSYWHREHEVAIFLSKTAWSIALLSLIRKSQKNSDKIFVWIPDYFCNASLNILRKTGVEIIFYPILENLEPDYSSFKELINKKGPPDIFLLVHYFGKPNATNRSVEFCNKNGSWLVEDAAHALRPIKGIGEAGDFVLYSPHKLLPLPDGAILTVRPNGPSHLNTEIIDIIFKNGKWKEFLSEMISSKRGAFNFKGTKSVITFFIKQFLQNLNLKRYIKQPFYDIDQPTFAPFVCPKPDISQTSLKILSGFCKKLPKLELIRERNQMLWDYCIDKFCKNGNTILNPSIRPVKLNWCTYLSSYEGDENVIADFYNSLETKKFLPTTWPDLPPEVLKNKTLHNVAIKLRYSRFYLPVHQSLNRSHFKKIIKEASSFINKNKLVIKNEWNKISKPEWDNLIVQYGKSNLLQSWTYGQTKFKNEGWIVNRVVWYQDEKAVAFAQILEKKIGKLIRIYRVNRGPIFLNCDFFIKKEVVNQLLRIASIIKGNILSISLELEKNLENIALINETNLILHIQNGYSSIWIDLRLPLETIRKSLNGKWRNMLVFAENQELEIESGTSQNLLNWLCDIHNKNMKGKGFKGISSEFLKSMALEVDTKNPIIVYKASYRGTAVGALCVAYHGNAATYLIGWTNEEGRRLKANYLLLWEAIKELQDRKKDWFDLGGIDPEATPGITAFKAGMSGELYSIVPSGWCINI